MFMIATTQTIVAAPAAHSGQLLAPEAGEREAVDGDAEADGDRAGRDLAAELPHHGRPRKSSIAPTVVAIAAPSRIPR